MRSGNTYGYDFGNNRCTLHNRDEENAIGFETQKLTIQEANALGMFCERLYKAGLDDGRESLARSVRGVLPQPGSPDAKG